MATKFTAIVLTLNESRYLERCLASLSFCDEIMVFDLGSHDESPEIARRSGATVAFRSRVEVAEMLRCEVAPLARNDWLVFVDPDEEYPDGVERCLREVIEQNANVGMIGLPLDNFICGKKVERTQFRGGTKWAVCHRGRVKLSPIVHRGIDLRPGYERVVACDRSTGMVIRHNWMTSWGQFLDKQLRYVRREGAAYDSMGLRFGWWPAVRHTVGTLKRNLIDQEGWRGGVTGAALSLMASCYVAMSWRSLRRYQRSGYEPGA